VGNGRDEKGREMKEGERKREVESRHAFNSTMTTDHRKIYTDCKNNIRSQKNGRVQNSMFCFVKNID